MRLVDADAMSKRYHNPSIYDTTDLDEMLSYEPTIDILQWISVTERLPEPEQRVLACTETHCSNGEIYKHVTTAMYEDGNMWREDSSWNFNDFDNLENYDEEQDDYKIPEGWWEYTIYNDEEGNYRIDDFVTHWMPLPKTPEVNNERY